jgi:hypothetical protein
MGEQIQQIQKNSKHIVVSKGKYEIIKRYGKYGDTIDTILGRILVAAAEQRRKEEQLVIS